jgi:hypothetical protein
MFSDRDFQEACPCPGSATATEKLPEQVFLSDRSGTDLSLNLGFRVTLGRQLQCATSSP